MRNYVVVSGDWLPSASENQATIALGPFASTPPKSNPVRGDHASTTTQPRPRQSISQPPGVMKRVVAEQERRVDHPMSAGSDPMPIR